MVAGVSLGVSRLKPAAPTVERATVWTDTVKRGPMVREVSGLGSLVPEQILWIPAMMGGRVERINELGEPTKVEPTWAIVAAAMRSVTESALVTEI